jgi:hypothetical protein
MKTKDQVFKAKIVYLILSKNTSEALQLLSSHYGVVEPKLRIGMPKRYSKNPGCYVHNRRTIHISRREILYDPFVILHEFYHHLRRVSNAQGGIEKYADRFAKDYLRAYQELKHQSLTDFI